VDTNQVTEKERLTLKGRTMMAEVSSRFFGKALMAILVLALTISSAFGQSGYKKQKHPNGQVFYNFGVYIDRKHQKTMEGRMQFFQKAFEDLKGDDENALLWTYLCQVKGISQLDTLDQGNLGSCVGFGAARTCDITAACDILHRGDAERYVAFAPGALYAMGRDHAGRLGSWDGSTGSWMVDCLTKLGSLHAIEYDSHDLREYSVPRAKSWAAQGVPAELKEVAKEHPFSGAAKVSTAEQAKASLQNGYAILLCANSSYGSRRDSLGFLRKTGNNWAHAMACIAYRNSASGREGFLIQNSWKCNGHSSGWVTGPIWPDASSEFPQPVGSFWVTPADLETHLKDDCWAVSGYEGFRQRELEWPEVFHIGGTKERKRKKTGPELYTAP
jgi:hypothetical protein